MSELETVNWYVPSGKAAVKLENELVMAMTEKSEESSSLISVGWFWPGRVRTATDTVPVKLVLSLTLAENPTKLDPLGTVPAELVST